MILKISLLKVIKDQCKSVIATDITAPNNTRLCTPNDFWTRHIRNNMYKHFYCCQFLSFSGAEAGPVFSCLRLFRAYKEGIFSLVCPSIEKSRVSSSLLLLHFTSEWPLDKYDPQLEGELPLLHILVLRVLLLAISASCSFLHNVPVPAEGVASVFRSCLQ